jgi:hypothetical protein
MASKLDCSFDGKISFDEFVNGLASSDEWATIFDLRKQRMAHGVADPILPFFHWVPAWHRFKVVDGTMQQIANREKDREKRINRTHEHIKSAATALAASTTNNNNNTKSGSGKGNGNTTAVERGMTLMEDDDPMGIHDERDIEGWGSMWQRARGMIATEAELQGPKAREAAERARAQAEQDGVRKSEDLAEFWDHVRNAARRIRASPSADNSRAGTADGKRMVSDPALASGVMNANHQYSEDEQERILMMQRMVEEENDRRMQARAQAKEQLAKRQARKARRASQKAIAKANGEEVTTSEEEDDATDRGGGGGDGHDGADDDEMNEEDRQLEEKMKELDVEDMKQFVREELGEWLDRGIKYDDEIQLKESWDHISEENDSPRDPNGNNNKEESKTGTADGKVGSLRESDDQRRKDQASRQKAFRWWDPKENAIADEKEPPILMRASTSNGNRPISQQGSSTGASTLAPPTIVITQAIEDDAKLAELEDKEEKSQALRDERAAASRSAMESYRRQKEVDAVRSAEHAKHLAEKAELVERLRAAEAQRNAERRRELREAREREEREREQEDDALLAHGAKRETDDVDWEDEVAKKRAEAARILAREETLNGAPADGKAVVTSSTKKQDGTTTTPPTADGSSSDATAPSADGRPTTTAATTARNSGEVVPSGVDLLTIPDRLAEDSVDAIFSLSARSAQSGDAAAATNNDAATEGQPRQRRARAKKPAGHTRVAQSAVRGSGRHSAPPGTESPPSSGHADRHLLQQASSGTVSHSARGLNTNQNGAAGAVRGAIGGRLAAAGRAISGNNTATQPPPTGYGAGSTMGLPGVDIIAVHPGTPGGGHPPRSATANAVLIGNGGSESARGTGSSGGMSLSHPMIHISPPSNSRELVSNRPLDGHYSMPSTPTAADPTGRVGSPSQQHRSGFASVGAMMMNSSSATDAFVVGGQGGAGGMAVTVTAPQPYGATRTSTTNGPMNPPNDNNSNGGEVGGAYQHNPLLSIAADLGLAMPTGWDTGAAPHGSPSSLTDLTTTTPGGGGGTDRPRRTGTRDVINGSLISSASPNGLPGAHTRPSRNHVRRPGSAPTGGAPKLDRPTSKGPVSAFPPVEGLFPTLPSPQPLPSPLFPPQYAAAMGLNQSASTPLLGVPGSGTNGQQQEYIPYDGQGNGGWPAPGVEVSPNDGRSPMRRLRESKAAARKRKQLEREQTRVNLMSRETASQRNARVIDDIVPFITLYYLFSSVACVCVCVFIVGS